MNLCSEGHDEVCYEARRCPVCEMHKDLSEKVDRLEEHVADLEGQVDELTELLNSEGE